jgi:hypothetical protein
MGKINEKTSVKTSKNDKEFLEVREKLSRYLLLEVNQKMITSSEQVWWHISAIATT